MTANICTTGQCDALVKIVQGIEQTCPMNGTNPDGSCTSCGGLGKIKPYADLDAWLKAHGKKELFIFAPCGFCELDAYCPHEEEYTPVLHIFDALEVLEEAGWHIEYSGTPGQWWRYKAPGGTVGSKDSAAELLAAVLAYTEQEAEHAEV